MISLADNNKNARKEGNTQVQRSGSNADMRRSNVTHGTENNSIPEPVM